MSPDAPIRRTILITGSTDGLGRAVATRLAASPDTLVLLHGRRSDALVALADELEVVGGVRPLTFTADFAELGQVRRLAGEVTAGVDRLDVLVNNAGIGFGEPDGVDRRESVDGHELRFAVNHLAGFLLALELLPLLCASRPARVVDVASIGQNEIDLDDLGFRNDYDGVVAYRRSKLAQIMCGRELAALVDPSDVTFNSLHPASLMPTKIVTGSDLAPRDSVESGVDAVVRLVEDPEMVGRTGSFFDRTEVAKAHPQADDAVARSALFERCLELVGHRRPARSRS